MKMFMNWLKRRGSLVFEEVSIGGGLREDVDVVTGGVCSSTSAISSTKGAISIYSIYALFRSNDHNLILKKAVDCSIEKIAISCCCLTSVDVQEKPIKLSRLKAEERSLGLR